MKANPDTKTPLDDNNPRAFNGAITSREEEGPWL